MKRLVAKVGEYTNQQNETKGEYVRIGALMENDNGEYMLLDPTVNLSGVLQKQNAYAISQQKNPNTNVMVSVFSADNQNGQQNNQRPQGGNHQAGGQQQGQRTQGNQQQNNPPMAEPDFSFDQDIPF